MKKTNLDNTMNQLLATDVDTMHDALHVYAEMAALKDAHQHDQK